MKAFMIVCGVLTAGVIVFINELGKYIDDINPYAQRVKDLGNDFDEVKIEQDVIERRRENVRDCR